MDIRNDIYPNPEAQKYLQALAYRTQEAFPTIFPTVDDVIRYVNNFKNPTIAGLFLDVGDYYNSAKFYACPKCFPPKRIETCPHCNNTFEMPAFIVLIMIISVMEKLASADTCGVESWFDFYNWVSRKDINKSYEQTFKNKKFKDFKQLMDKLKAQYSAEFGSVNKVTNFLSKIMSTEEKRTLIKSIKYMQKVPELPPKKLSNIESSASFEEIQKKIQKSIEADQKVTFASEEDVRSYVKKNCSKTAWEALPVCFEPKEYWKCYAIEFDGRGHGYCRFKYDCALLTDKEKLDKYFKNTVKTIYEWRSKFVHDVQLPPVRETAIYGGRHKGKYVIVELTTTDFKPVFERLVKKFFDKFQVNH
jgi:hypothetical protein